MEQLIDMADGTFRLKGRDIFKLGQGVEKVTEFSFDTRISPQVIYPHLKDDPLERPGSIKFDHLARMLLDGLKMTPKEAMNLRLGDVLEYVEFEEHAE